MESIKIYQDSLKELQKVRKQLAFPEITINMKSLDAKTKEAVTYALSHVISDRVKAVTAVITNSTEV